MPRTPTDDDGRWHLDKKVPLALIIAIIGQSGAFIWWGATMSARVDLLERDNAKLERRVDTADTVVRTANERLIRVEEKSASILELVRQLADRDRSKVPPQ